MINCYVALNKDVNVARNSSSAGAFSAIIETVCHDNFKVYGAAFNKDFVVEHISIDKIDDLYKLRGSKYVLSDLNNAFSKINNDLNSGKFVVFSGTPCQVAGLNNFFKKDYDNLLTIDVVCHGTPSPVIFKKYIDYLQKKYNSKLKSFTFAHKRYGWIDRRVKADFENGKSYERLSITYDDLYMSAYFSHLISRKCCSKCKYATVERGSDITLADCWGVEKHFPDININNGVSMILTNTQKGENIVKNLSEKMIIYNANLNDLINDNPQLISPPSYPDNYEEALKYALENSFEDFAKKYVKTRPYIKRKLSELKYALKYLINK